MGGIKVTQENIDHALVFTGSIVNNFPRRLSGSDSCLKAGKAIADEFSRTYNKGSVNLREWQFAQVIDENKDLRLRTLSKNHAEGNSR
jgi:hypothetical protein